MDDKCKIWIQYDEEVPMAEMEEVANRAREMGAKVYTSMDEKYSLRFEVKDRRVGKTLMGVLLDTKKVELGKFEFPKETPSQE